MKHNYKIKVNGPMPSDEQIAKHKDFGRLLEDYQKFTQPIYKKPLYKNPKLFMGVFLVGVIAMLVFRAVDEEQQSHQADSIATTQDSRNVAAVEAEFGKPPFKELAPKVEKSIWSGDDAVKLDLPGGRTLEIPAKAFTDAEGNPFDGVYELFVQDYSDPLDIMLAGFHLQWPDQKRVVTSHLIDIRAVSNGNELKIKPGVKLAYTTTASAAETATLKLAHFSPKLNAWEMASPENKLQFSPSGKTEKPKTDGFGVVEFDANGKPIAQSQPKGQKPSEPAAYVEKIELAELGAFLVMQEAKAGMQYGAILSLKHNDELIKPGMLFGIEKGSPILNTYTMDPKSNTYDFQWKDEDKTVFFCLLSDRHLLQVSAKEILAATGPGVTEPMALVMISESPVQSKAELMQLLGM